MDRYFKGRTWMHFIVLWILVALYFASRGFVIWSNPSDLLTLFVVIVVGDLLVHLFNKWVLKVKD